MCLAVPGRVVRVEERDATPMAEVDFGGVRKEVCLQYIPDAAVGDYLMVHVGFAIQRLDEASALESLRLFENLGLLEEEFGDGFAAAARQAGEGTGR
jgi:hydrogenase expression/formation protein HypC